jgi:hypothetical protein
VAARACAQATDVGKKVLVPYTADYVFHKYANGDKLEPVAKLGIQNSELGIRARILNSKFLILN